MAPAAGRRHWRKVDSMRSKNWFMRVCRRSCSKTMASPTITRTMPGFFSPNCSSNATTRLALRTLVTGSCAASGTSRPTICCTSVKTDCSMNSISPSNIWALLAKWRYRAASLTLRWAARAAVVIRSAPGFSSMEANACRICSRRSPGLGRLRAGAMAGAAGLSSAGFSILETGDRTSDSDIGDSVFISNFLTASCTVKHTTILTGRCQVRQTNLHTQQACGLHPELSPPLSPTRKRNREINL